MVVYWLMFLVPAIASLTPWRAGRDVQLVAWLITGLAFTAIIGLRFQVGADWEAYLRHYDATYRVPLDEALVTSDLGYALVNWLAGLVDGGVYLVNLFCASLVMLGVVTFCRRQPLPWLALLVAVPYILIVVSMGYTRQGVAMGLELLALVALIDGRQRRFVVFVLLGALFHKSAILLLPLAVLASTKNRAWVLFWVGLTSVGFGALLLIEHYESLVQNYVRDEMVSDGGPIRVALNALPAVLVVLFGRRLAPDDRERSLWFWIAIFSLACLPMVGLASTAVDRIALYFMPIQMYVFSRLHRLTVNTVLRGASICAIIISYGLIQWVWLTYSNHSSEWLPYQIFPFVECVSTGMPCD